MASSDRIIYWDLSKDGLKTSTNDLAITTNETAVLESVVNIVTTERSTKVFFKRDFGTSLSKFLFAPIDMFIAIDIFEEIEASITKYEKRALDLRVDVTPIPNDNTFIIDIYFRIEESEKPLELTLNLKKIR